jgi:hypothetical protein
LQLQDVLGELHFARRENDLGRLALLTYWEVRRWARAVRREALAELAGTMFTDSPHVSRDHFLAQVDLVIHELERIDATLH